MSSYFLSCFSTSPLFHGLPVAAVIAVAGHPDVVVAAFAAAVLSPEVFVLAAAPEVFALVFAAAELFPEVAVLVAAPEVFALFFAAAALSPEVFVLAAEPGVVFVVDLDVSEPQASVDIAFLFVVLVPAAVVVVEVYSSEHPKFLAFPNVDYFASSSNSVEVVG